MNSEIYGGKLFVMTCCACPEQYDVFNKNNEKVGYVRLRWGRFTVSCPGPHDELVYSAESGGNLDGCFYDSDERVYQLLMAAKAIDAWEERKKQCQCCNSPGAKAQPTVDSLEWVCDCSCHPKEEYTSE